MTSKRRTTTRTLRPLDARLPNPTPHFIGRQREVRAVVSCVKRAPLTIVQGPGGFGKTALVRFALHRHFKRETRATVVIDFRAPAPPVPVVVAAGLARALGIGAPTADGGPLDFAALEASILDTVETRHLWVVLDNFHNADAATADSFLTLIARHAHDSRWIATTRTEPRIPENVGQLVEVRAMPARALARLARVIHPRLRPALIRKLALAAHGSPWELLQLDPVTLGWGQNARTSPDALLPPGATELLTLLGQFERPLQLETLNHLGAAAKPSVALRLERRGLIERTTAGIRLHDCARKEFEASGGDANTAALAGALATTDDANAQIEALRLFAEGGDARAAAKLLDERGGRLIADGHAGDLLASLGISPPRGLQAWQLRLAVIVGDPAFLAAIDGTRLSTAEERLLFARGLFLRSEFAAASPLPWW